MAGHSSIDTLHHATNVPAMANTAEIKVHRCLLPFGDGGSQPAESLELMTDGRTITNVGTLTVSCVAVGRVDVAIMREPEAIFMHSESD